MDRLLLNKVYSFIDILFHPVKHGTKQVSIRRCPVSGLDISMQPRNSKFLSPSGVKWYYNNKPELYIKLLEPRLRINWREKSLHEQFREIAHAVRNADSNPRNNIRRAVSRLLHDDNTLFNNIKLIDKSKLREAGLE